MPNRFELVLLAASAITLDRENDKNAVIALREIAAKTIQAGDVREGPIHSMLHNAEVNESEAAVVPTLPPGAPPGSLSAKTSPPIRLLM